MSDTVLTTFMSLQSSITQLAMFQADHMNCSYQKYDTKSNAL